MGSSILEKRERSLEIIRTALKGAAKPAAVLTEESSSIVLLHLLRSVEEGRLPVAVVEIDALIVHPQIRVYLEKMKKLWNFTSLREEIDPVLHRIQRASGAREVSETWKQHLLKAVHRYAITHLFVPVCHGRDARKAREAYFSESEGYVRVNPVLHFGETDLREYMERYGIPLCSLFESASKGRSMEDLLMIEKDGEERERKRKLESLGYF
jgi:phosphoadenosine phosphosulfate reductase